MVATNFEEDFDDILYNIMQSACEVGMLPSQFWEEEPADTMIYVQSIANKNRHELYSSALLTAEMFAVVLSNGFRAKGHKPMEYPKFEEVFPSSQLRNDNKTNAFDRRIAQLKLQFGSRRK